ncbi:restriction endonuclease [Scatolibacter rhodanostii]|uniref:restriction endonuclease n=1 Tax=Scatolibacter rhodanostii TaxID=2014781 RepID=UPI0013562A25|nr:restriction endonuclease [Scatolibacter rhodanostii]
MTGYEYEEFAASYLRSHGYRKVKITKASGDFGVDIIAHKHWKKYAVQCKYYSRTVGNAAIQEAVAGKAYYGCNAAMVITNSTFTRPAKELAHVNDVQLIENVFPHRFSFKKDELLEEEILPL